MKKIIYIILLTFSLTLLISCSNNLYINVNYKTINLYETNTHLINYDTNDELGVSFDSSDELIAKVSDEGLIEAISKGEATINIKSKSNNKVKETIKVNVDNFKIDSTYTFDAKLLYDLIDLNESSNIKLENNKLVKIDNEKPNAKYKSIPIHINEFSELVMTFNSNKLTKGTISYNLYLGNDKKMSDSFTMGIDLAGNYRSMSNQEQDFGKVSIDTLINKQPLENKKIVLEVLINSSNDVFIKNLSVTTKQYKKELTYNEENLIEKVIDVPPINQLSVDNIGNLICSPTSVTMVLNYYRKDAKQLDVSSEVKDHGANGIYGNWTFNASYAGTYDGLTSRVEYIHNFDDVVNYIKNDIPVIFSITTNKIEDLDNSIMAFPAGHLIVLIGFEKINDKWYGIFNDPAEYKDELVLRKYDMDQMLKVWKQYTYIIKED